MSGHPLKPLVAAAAGTGGPSHAKASKNACQRLRPQLLGITLHPGAMLRLQTPLHEFI